MERTCITFRIKPGTRPEYIKRHNAIWPELVELMQKYGFSNQSIFINNNHVIGYLESEGNYQEQSLKFAKEDISIAWQKYFNDIIEISNEESQDSRYIPYEEVWHLD